MYSFIYLRFLLVALFVLFLPGWLLSRIIFKRADFDILQTFPISFCLSLVCLILPTVLAYLFELSLIAVAYIYLGVILIVFLWNIAGRDKQRRVQSPIQSGDVTATYFRPILISLLVVFSALGLYFGAYLWGDALTYVNLIRKLLKLPEVALRNGYIKGIQSSVYGYNLWHISLAIVSWSSKLDPAEVFLFLPSLLIPTSILAFFSFSHTLFRDKRLAYICTFLYIFWYGFLSYDIRTGRPLEMWFWSSSAYPRCLARDILMPIGGLFVFRYIAKGNRRDLFLLNLLGLALALTHGYYFLLFMLAFIFYLISCLVFKRQDKALIKRLRVSIFLIFFPSALYLFWLARQLYPISNPAFLLPWAIGSYQPMLFLGERYPIINPFIGLWQNALHRIAFVFIPLLALYAKKSNAGAFLFANIVFPTFILLNPLLLKSLRGFSPALDRFYNMTETIPYVLIAGFSGYKVLSYLRQRLSQFGCKAVLFKGLSVMFLSLFIFCSVDKFALLKYYKNPRYTAKKTWESLNRDSEFVNFVRRNLPAGSVILTHGILGEFWVFYFPHYVVATSRYAHMPPNLDPTQRIRDIEKFFHSQISGAHLHILKRYDVDYVVVDRRSHSIDLSNIRGLESIYRSDKFQVYRVRRL
jgi:hypothetical protein